MGKINKVLIVGAGPAGLLLALQLARNNITVQVLDQNSRLDEQPRATHYGPPACWELDRAGVFDEVTEQGFVMRQVVWRKLDGSILSGLNVEDMGDDYKYKITCLPLNRLARIIMQHIEKQPKATVTWSRKVVGLGEADGKAWVDVMTPVGRERMEADFVVGCDGANSQVRKSLLGEKNFPGFTWDEQIVATNTYIDIDKFGWTDSSFIIHPEHAFMAARIGKGAGREAMWRITYMDKPGLSWDELVKRQPMKFEAFLPGHPKQDQYTISNISPYKIHQRCAEKMRVGRFLLAADAAHLCNPFGGLGLTGGIVDASGLVDCLVGIHTGQADDSILDKYSEVRRQKFYEMVNPISTENFRRLYDQDPEKAMETDEFLKMCKRTETDKEFSKELQMGVMALQHDFTQYYTKSRNGVNGMPTENGEAEGMAHHAPVAVAVE